MLSKIRDKHKRRILWILATVIIVAFGLSGAGFYLGRGEKKVIGKIGDKNITLPQFRQAIKMAQVYTLLNYQDLNSFSPLDFQNLALDLLVLLWKAEQEGIIISDQEVIDYIMKNFFSKGKFDRQLYESFLRNLSQRYNLGLSPRIFEEYIRSFIAIDKLFQKYISIEVKPEEIQELYARDNQKAKIAYLRIPYEKFKFDLGISPRQIEEFYQKNKNLFQRKAKINIAYILIDKKIIVDKRILPSLKKIKSLNELQQKFSLEIKETGLIAISDPIKDIGWQPEINKLAFKLPKNTLSQPIETKKGILLMEKRDEQPAFTPPLEEIEDEVKERLVLEEAKNQTEQFSQELLKKLHTNKIKNLQEFARQENIEYKETDYFKFYDYIEGLGLDPQISEVVFSLKEGEIEDSPFLRDDAAYIIQLKEITPFDNKDFQEKKDAYRKNIIKAKEARKRLQFLEQIKKEASLTTSEF